MRLKSFKKNKKKNLKINLQKIEQIKLDTENEIKKIIKNVDEELKIITERKQNTFEKIQNRQKKKLNRNKKEILSMTIFFT